MAEAVLRDHATRLGLTQVASAGVWASSRRQEADKRALQALHARSYGLDRRWRSRRVRPEDFDEFDLLLAMDREVLRGLEAVRPARSPARLALFLQGMTGLGRDEVPDPYFGTAEGFERVLDLIEARTQAWPAPDALTRHFTED